MRPAAAPGLQCIRQGVLRIEARYARRRFPHKQVAEKPRIAPKIAFMTSARLFDRLIAPIERLVTMLTDPTRRERACVALLFAYVAIWTLYGVLAKSSEDVHPDMSELLAWSRDLSFGYPKHPPLSAWLTAAWFAVFPVSDWAFYLLAMAVAGLALWIAWRLAGDFLDAEKRVLVLALLMFVPFFNFHALKFNANTVLLPLWGATALCFLRSFERRSAVWAALAGLCAAGAMLGKYWSVFLLAGLGLAALLDSRRGAYFRSAAPWVTIAVGAVALAPHVVWLIRNDFEPFTYAINVHAVGYDSSALKAALYLVGLVGYVALAGVLALAVMRPSRAALLDMLQPATPERRLAASVFWGPLLIPALIGPLVGVSISSLWSIPAWSLLPVVLLSSPLVLLHRRAMLMVVALAVLLPPAMVAAAPAIAIVIHRQEKDLSVSHSRLLAERVAYEWRRATDKPLKLIGGEDELIAGTVFYLPGQVSSIPGFRPKKALRGGPEQLRRDGVALICSAADPRCLPRARNLGVTEPSIGIEVEIVRMHRGVAGRSARYEIFIIPPQP